MNNCVICGAAIDSASEMCEKCMEKYERTLERLADTLREQFASNQIYEDLNRN